MNGRSDGFGIVHDTRYPILMDRWDGEGSAVGCVDMMRLDAIATMSTVSHNQIYS